MEIQVLFIRSEHVVAMGIENQLQAAQGLQIITLPSANEAAIVEQINTHPPDVIVMNGSTEFATTKWLTKFMNDTPNLKIVIVQLENNLIQVYQKNMVPLDKGSDLIAAIL